MNPTGRAANWDQIISGTTITGSWLGARIANMENRAMKVMYIATRTLERLNHLYINRSGSALMVKGQTEEKERGGTKSGLR